MATSIRVHDDVLKNFQEMRSKKSQQYSLYCLNEDGKSIVLDSTKTGEAPTDRKIFQSFVEELPADECRYVVYDFKYSTKEDGQCNKLVFIVWCPEDADLKQKEQYAHLKPDVRQKLSGVSQEFYITHEDDLDYEDMKDSLGI